MLSAKWQILSLLKSAKPSQQNQVNTKEQLNHDGNSDQYFVWPALSSSFQTLGKFFIQLCCYLEQSKKPYRVSSSFCSIMFINVGADISLVWCCRGLKEGSRASGKSFNCIWQGLKGCWDWKSLRDSFEGLRGGLEGLISCWQSLTRNRESLKGHWESLMGHWEGLRGTWEGLTGKWEGLRGGWLWK